MKIDKINKMSLKQLNKLSDKSEYTIQCECTNWAKINNILFFAVPNEATRLNSKYIKSGVLSGVSDTIVCLPNKVLFIEFKTSTGTQSKSQKEFESKIDALGLPYYICRSLEGFKEIVDNNI